MALTFVMALLLLLINLSLIPYAGTAVIPSMEKVEDNPIAEITAASWSEAFAITEKLSFEQFKLDSLFFCNAVSCPWQTAYYDPSSDLCRCPDDPENDAVVGEMKDTLFSSGPSEQEALLDSDECENVCLAPFKPSRNSHDRACTCVIEPLSSINSSSRSMFQPQKTTPEYYMASRRIWSQIMNFNENLGKRSAAIRLNKKAASLTPRQSSTTIDAMPEMPLATYVPPPKTDVTPALIQQSLEAQPQKSAIISSIIPIFHEGIIQLRVQLNAIAQTIVLNSTTSLPCDTIGTDSETTIVLVPRSVKHGTPQTTLPICLVIAVNKYSPDWIDYWVQNTLDGSVYTLRGDSKIHDIDQLNTNQPAAIAVRAAKPKPNKRSTKDTFDVSFDYRQILVVSCLDSCPLPSMIKLHTNTEVCGCIGSDITESKVISSRTIEEPNAFTATMSFEACTAMKCINNDNKPALYNPLSKTCWCVGPQYVDFNPAADMNIV